MAASSRKTPTKKSIQAEIQHLADPQKAKDHQWFFKTGPGEYGEGDVFRGVTMPKLRQVAKRNRDLPMRSTLSLLKSKYHEDRMVALLILVDQYKRGDARERQEVFDAYLMNTAFINNWDLVDCSAHKIVGPHLLESKKTILHELARSESLWERRISIISTLAFIYENDTAPTFRLAKTLLRDEEDLIHKAVGWMLREAGKRDESTLVAFLQKHYDGMPRTMLRYAIEKFPKERRKRMLKGEFS